MKKKVLAVILTATMVLSLTACGGNSNSKSSDKKETKTEESKDESLKAEKNLLSVEVTLPASFVGDDSDSTATLDAKAKEAGVKEITKNEDGSVTYKMTKAAHKELLAGIKTSIDENINEILADKETYPSFDSIVYNDDVTQFDVNVDPATFGGFQSFAAIIFYLEGNIYQALNTVPEDQIKTIVNFKNKDTGEIIESGDSSSMGESSTTE